MNAFDLVVWAFAACVSLMLVGIGVAVVVAMVQAVRKPRVQS